jgi:hypothetical protein
MSQGARFWYEGLSFPLVVFPLIGPALLAAVLIVACVWRTGAHLFHQQRRPDPPVRIWGMLCCGIDPSADDLARLILGLYSAGRTVH